MTYINNKNEVYYDFNMIADLLPVHPSLLKREMKKYAFKREQFVKYKNRHLYSLNAVTDFIVFFVKERSGNKKTKKQDYERDI